MQINELLPIGSVVRLKDAEKYLMIFGIKQSTSEQENEEVSDYICVPYPEGNLGLEYQFLINHEDIEEIIFRGFENDERDMFIETLSQIY